MAFVDFASREIHCKIVYYGPGLCGKTKNLQLLHERTAPARRGQLISLATPNERTLFFDFLPLDVGSLRGFQTRLHLYTVPGQVFYDAARRAILRGTDGIVFVADSQEARLAANEESVRNLEKNLREQEIEIGEIPYVLQLNKRDLPSALPAVLTGVRLGFSLTLIGTILGEMFGSQSGLGYLLMTSIGLQNTDIIMAVTVLLIAFAASASTVLLTWERHLRRRR